MQCRTAITGQQRTELWKYQVESEVVFNILSENLKTPCRGEQCLQIATKLTTFKACTATAHH